MNRIKNDKFLHQQALLVAFSLLVMLLGALDSSVSYALDQKNEAVQEFHISSVEFKRGLRESLERVDEFLFIRKEAKKLGVKVYLFGGTAAAFAHYVKWDLLRQKGDSRFYKDRFDYSYVNVYRSTQDLDIVVDGSVEAIGQLEQSLRDHFPYLQGSKGSKSSWEVRSLRESHGTKLALLDNPDFLNQNTDSQSVGMIEVSEGANETGLVRDLRDWENLENPQFLLDILEGKIHYYFSPLHETTKFYKEGRNPPIVSVIRYFIKVFQVDLTMREEEKAQIQQIISAFDPASIENNSYLKTWFENNAPKLIQNAIDVEMAMNILNETGLRKKLSQIGSIQTEYSVAWWMDKQPLLSHSLGQKGRTAREIGLTTVAHETRSYLVYEAITRSHKGLPNVLISRKGKVGEAALFGDGFYTIAGMRSGFVGSGLTIRFNVDPEAREGIDFKFVNNGQYILILNRNALKVIPEGMVLDLVGYYSMLLGTKDVSKDDLGIFHRLRLALRSRFLQPHPDELKFLNSLSVKDLLKLVSKDSTIEGSLLLLKIINSKKLSAQEIVGFADVVYGLRISRQFVQKDQKEIYEKFYEEFRESWLRQFLAQSPNLAQCKKALEVGLFKGNENEYLRILYPELKTVDDIAPALRHWKTWSKNRDHKKEVNEWLIKIGHLFYSLSPNENHVDEFNKVMMEMADIMPLALAGIYFEDPLVLSLSIQQASRNKAIPQDSILKLWRHQKNKFFSFVPSASDLRSFLDQVEIAEIQLDILEYAINHRVFLRRSDLIGFMNSLAAWESLTSLEKVRADALLRRMTEKFFAMNPSMPEVSSYFGSVIISDTIQNMLLSYKRFAITNEDDLVKFIKSVGNSKKANELLLQNPHWTQGYTINVLKVNELLKLLDFGEASVLFLKGALEHNRDRTELILEWLQTSIRQWAYKYPETFDEAWELCFSDFEQNGSDSRKIGAIETAIPTAKSYRKFMDVFLGKINILDDYLPLPRMNISWGAKQTYFTAEETLLILEVNDDLLPRAVERAMKELKDKTPKTSPLPISKFANLASYLGSSGAVIRLLRLFLNFGATNNTYDDINLSSNKMIYKEAPIDVIKRGLLDYHLKNSFEFTNKHNLFTMEFLASHLKQTLVNGSIQDHELMTESDIIAPLVRTYLLAGLRNRKVGLNGKEYKNGFKAKYDQSFNFGDLKDEALKTVCLQVKHEIELQYASLIADTSGTTGGLWNPITRVLNATVGIFGGDGVAHLEAQLEQDLSLTHDKIREQLRVYLETKSKSNQKKADLSLSCEAALKSN